MNTEPQTPEEKIGELEEKLAESERELARVNEANSFQSVMNMFLILFVVITMLDFSSGDGFWARHKMTIVVALLLLQFVVAIIWQGRVFLRALKDSRPSKQA
jgi:hypothetical protein